MTSPYTKRSLDLWPWPIWLRQISSKHSNCWIFDFWDSRPSRYINSWGPLCPFFLFNNYIWPLLTPRVLLTFDPDLFGCAKFRQNTAIVGFLIFEIPDLAYIKIIEGLCAHFFCSIPIYDLSLHQEVSWPLTLTNLVKPNFVKLRQLVNFWFLSFSN
jgi:hypothetical protein